MRQHVIRLCEAALILSQIGAVQAAEQLSRKPGLWEVKTTLDNASAPPRVVKQCIDAATDELSQSIAGPFSAAVCPERKV
jgi:hypothetical protein